VALVVASATDVRLLARQVLVRLADCQADDGNLLDPLTGQPLPPSHYGASLFAGACALSGDPQLEAAGERAVRYYLALPARARGAHELNCLGLLAAYRRWQGAKGDLCRRLETHLLRMPFTSLSGHATNNWHAMRAVCLLQRGRALERRADVEAARRCLHQVVLPLQDTAGLFADYPPGGGPGRCTPLTYHAKFCAMLAMYLTDLPDAAAAAALRRAVVALAHLCAPDGETLYFGRSCNSVYGYAAALYALRWALQFPLLYGEERELVGHAAVRVREFLGRLVGSGHTYPSPFERERLGWDDYVDRVDYAAFAAFLLTQTPPGQEATPPSGSVRWEATDAGIRVEGKGKEFAAFATKGQFHPGSYLFVDARSSGLQVLTWKHGGHTVVPPPPHDMTDPTDPRWVGFMPVVEASGRSWAVRRYDRVEAFPTDFGVALAGVGVPTTLPRTAAHRAARLAEHRAWLGLAVRVARGLAKSLGVTPPGAYRPLPLPDGEVRRALVWFREEGCLVCVDRFRGPAETAWSTVRLATPLLLFGEVLRFHHRGVRGEVRCLAGGGLPEVKEVFTSNGMAYVARYPLHPGVPTVVAVVLEEVETSCTLAGGLVSLQVGGRSALVDLDGLEVRW
jgi:hypothetical protein